MPLAALRASTFVSLLLPVCILAYGSCWGAYKRLAFIGPLPFAPVPAAGGSWKGPIIFAPPNWRNHKVGTYITRVPQFLSLVGIGTPHPLFRKRACSPPPWTKGGGGTRSPAGEEGGGVPIRTPGENLSTLFTLWVEPTPTHASLCRKKYKYFSRWSIPTDSFFD